MTSIPSVPSSVTRQQVADLVAALGIDPRDIPRGATLTLGPNSVTIDVYARDDNGQLYPGPDGSTAALHHVSIPVTDEETP